MQNCMRWQDGVRRENIKTSKKNKEHAIEQESVAWVAIYNAAGVKQILYREYSFTMLHAQSHHAPSNMTIGVKKLFA